MARKSRPVKSRRTTSAVRSAVRTRGRELVFLRAEQFGDLATRPVALDEMRKDRSVRDTKPADNLRHEFLHSRGPDLARPLCNISANELEGHHGTQIWPDKIWIGQIWIG